MCDSHRNIPDEMTVRIAESGGLIGIGYWETVICGTSPGDIVEHIRYAIDLLGVERVSLGSDYDGSVPMPFDVSEVAILTQVMLDKGFREDEIRAVMGGNMVRFLSERLPGRVTSLDAVLEKARALSGPEEHEGHRQTGVRKRFGVADN